MKLAKINKIELTTNSAIYPQKAWATFSNIEELIIMLNESVHISWARVVVVKRWLVWFQFVNK